MNATGERSLRFVHPDFDSAGAEAGLVTSPTGALELVDHDAAVRQAVLLVLTTSPGERVMRPDYGCDLRSLMFSPNDDTTAGLAKHLVCRALERWVPQAELLRIDVERRADRPGRLDLILEYQVRATRRGASVLIPVQRSGDDL